MFSLGGPKRRFTSINLLFAPPKEKIPMFSLGGPKRRFTSINLRLALKEKIYLDKSSLWSPSSPKSPKVFWGGGRNPKNGQFGVEYGASCGCPLVSQPIMRGYRLKIFNFSKPRSINRFGCKQSRETFYFRKSFKAFPVLKWLWVGTGGLFRVDSKPQGLFISSGWLAGWPLSCGQQAPRSVHQQWGWKVAGSKPQGLFNSSGVVRNLLTACRVLCSSCTKGVMMRNGID